MAFDPITVGNRVYLLQRVGAAVLELQAIQEYLLLEIAKSADIPLWKTDQDGRHLISDWKEITQIFIHTFETDYPHLFQSKKEP